MKPLNLWSLALLLIGAVVEASPERIVLAPGATTLVQCPRVEHIALGNSDIVSVVETIPGTLLLAAKAPGATQLWCLQGTKELAFDVVVTGIQQAMPTQYVLEVLIAELSASASQALGANTEMSGQLTFTGTGESAGFNPMRDTAAGFIGLDLLAALSALERQGRAAVWSRGQIRIESGGQAHLLAGGEIPIPGGEDSTEFRPYGLDLTVSATGVDLNTVALDVDLSLTALDYGVAINGVPGVSSRDLRSVRQFIIGQTVLLAQFERAERRVNQDGLPALMTHQAHSEESRVLWILVRPLLENRLWHRQAVKTPMSGGRGALGVYE